MPDGCVAIQQLLGEALVAGIHCAAAGVFVLALAALCFLFAQREHVHAHNLGLARFLRGCGWTILSAVAWIVVGHRAGGADRPPTALYVGEVVTVRAFGTAWLVKGRALWTGLAARRRAG